MTFGDMDLDTEQSELKARNTISLAFKEVRLLGYLMSRAGEEVTVRELIDEVWPGETVNPEVVWMYISFLRGKLQSVQASVIIDGDREHPFCLREI